VLMTARHGGIDLAAVMIFKLGRRCWYFYGASTEIERNRMPVYLLQWQAILWAKQNGCTEYDLWGIPDFPETILEEQFITRTDELWGVYRLKRGFGGQIKRSSQTMDFVLQPLLYKALMWWIKTR
jgi:peptidoglycan pentaglycine glycine transferase (the first glycine)